MDYDIDSYEFKYICEIKPEVDLKRDFLELSPQYLYNNQDNIPLNRYRKGPFCKFKISTEYKGRAGVYIIKVNGQVKYIGECEDLSNRYNIGYGQISPRNCFIGGQPTNCTINTYILNSNKNCSLCYQFLKVHSYLTPGKGKQENPDIIEEFKLPYFWEKRDSFAETKYIELEKTNFVSNHNK